MKPDAIAHQRNLGHFGAAQWIDRLFGPRMPSQIRYLRRIKDLVPCFG